LTARTGGLRRAPRAGRRPAAAPAPTRPATQPKAPAAGGAWGVSAWLGGVAGAVTAHASAAFVAVQGGTAAPHTPPGCPKPLVQPLAAAAPPLNKTVETKEAPQCPLSEGGDGT
jgi:hypothetical protein